MEYIWLFINCNTVGVMLTEHVQSKVYTKLELQRLIEATRTNADYYANEAEWLANLQMFEQGYALFSRCPVL